MQGMPEPITFSIVVPTYNRASQLRECLASLAAQDYPKSLMEVVIVDDGGRENLEPIITEFSEQFNMSSLRQPNAGPAAARNLGVRQATHQYLAFTDDDCLPTPSWLSCMAKAIAQCPDRIIGGKTVNILHQNAYSSTSQLILDIVYDNYNSDPEKARFFASNNMVVPRDTFLEIGGFLAGWRTSEDREICDRWLWHGHKMLYEPSAVVQHAHPLTLWSFCRQHFHYGKGAHYFHVTRQQRSSGNMGSEMSFHADLSNWLTAAFIRKAKRPVLMTILLMIWQVANLSGFLWARLVEKDRYLK